MSKTTSSNIVTFGKKDVNSISGVDVFTGTLPEGINRETMLTQCQQVDDWRDNVVAKISNETLDHVRGFKNYNGEKVSIENISLGGRTTLAVQASADNNLLAVVEFKHGEAVHAALESAKALFGKALPAE